MDEVRLQSARVCQEYINTGMTDKTIKFYVYGHECYFNPEMQDERMCICSPYVDGEY